MEDKFLKYSRLYVLVFLLFLSIPVTIGLLVAFFYGFSKLISLGPADLVFQLLVISLPASVLGAVYLIFFRRTARHPSAVVRIVSRLLFVVGLASCVFFLVKDIIAFFRQPSYDISDYSCFSIAFMAGNIATLFLVAILQAFTTEKEKDWREKSRERGL